MLARQLSRHDIQYCKPSTASLRDSSLFEIVSVSVRFHLLSLNLYILMVCEIRAEQELPNVNCPWLYVEVTFLLHQDHIFFFINTSSVKKGKKIIVWQKMMRNTLVKIPCTLSNISRHLLSVVSYICFSSLVCCYRTLADSG